MNKMKVVKTVNAIAITTDLGSNYAVIAATMMLSPRVKTKSKM